MPHTIDIKVRGYHLDVYGHVNNTRHLEFLEEARWSVIEEKIGIDTLMRRGLMFVIVNITINYRRAALLNEVLAIETTLASIKTRSAVLSQKTFLKGSDTVVADAEVTFVMLDGETQKPIVLNGEMARLFQRINDDEITSCH